MSWIRASRKDVCIYGSLIFVAFAAGRYSNSIVEPVLPESDVELVENQGSEELESGLKLQIPAMNVVDSKAIAFDFAMPISEKTSDGIQIFNFNMGLTR